MSEPRAITAGPRPGPAVRVWRLRDRTLTLGWRPLVMGIVNVTPDSFSDGGRYAATDAAVARALALVEEGADLIDIGGESSRPGAAPVPAGEELTRVVPVVEAVSACTSVPLSVDTTKAAVARECLTRGAQIVNDVTALGEPEMVEVVRESGAGVILMHMQGTPATMQLAPRYDDVVAEVDGYLERRVREVIAAGLDRCRLALDPGIGFGKTHDHNLALLAHLATLQRLGLPVCLGVSRKGLLSKLAGGGRSIEERLAGSLAVCCQAAIRGTAQIVRVHDVRATKDALLVVEAIERVKGQG